MSFRFCELCLQPVPATSFDAHVELHLRAMLQMPWHAAHLRRDFAADPPPPVLRSTYVCGRLRTDKDD